VNEMAKKRWGILKIVFNFCHFSHSQMLFAHSIERSARKVGVNCLKLAETARNYSHSLSSCTTAAAESWESFTSSDSSWKIMQFKGILEHPKLASRVKGNSPGLENLWEKKSAIENELKARQPGSKNPVNHEQFLLLFRDAIATFHNFYDLFRISS
jgi:hypothetical protein